ncbi:MAG: hypothetical protein ACJAVE_002110 [Polaribacter sp.]|jgi:hypothetical protein
MISIKKITKKCNNTAYFYTNKQSEKHSNIAYEISN